MNNNSSTFKATSLLVALVMLTTILLTGCGSVDDRVAGEFTKITNLKGVKASSGLAYTDSLSYDERLFFYKGNLEKSRIALKKVFPRVNVNVSSKDQVVFESGKYFGILEEGSYNGTSGSILYYAVQDQAMNRHYGVFVPYFGAGWLRMGGGRTTTKTTPFGGGTSTGNVYDNDSDGAGSGSVTTKSSNTVKGGSTGFGK